MKKIVVLFSLFLMGLFFINPVQASNIEFRNMDITANIQKDGSVKIREVWDISVYGGTEIYKVFNNMGASEVSQLKVTDDTGRTYQLVENWDVEASYREKAGKSGIIKTKKGYEICFGISTYGKRTYTFEYSISHFINQYTEDQGINYAFFSDMSIEPLQAKIRVSSPYAFSEDNAAIWAFGYNGTVNFEDGDVVMISDGRVPEGQKMQLLMRIDNGTFENAYDKDQDFQTVLDDAKQGSSYDNGGDNFFGISNGLIFSLMQGLLFIAAMGLAAGTIKRKVKPKCDYIFVDKKPLDRANVQMFRDIPCHKDIFEFYYLARRLKMIDQKDKGGLIAAILLKWIRDGFIHFEKVEESHLIFMKKDGFSIDLNLDISFENDLEAKLFGFLKSAAGENGRLETKEFERWCVGSYQRIEVWFANVEAFVEKKYREQGLLTMVTETRSYLGIKVRDNKDEFAVSVREEMEHILGLKMFLQEMSMIDEKEVIEVKLWEEYLLFASILGIADRVQEQLGKMCPDFNSQSSLNTTYTMRMVNHFVYSSMNVGARSAQSQRSSGGGGFSSFGGGGGGFSGGGGGGVR